MVVRNNVAGGTQYQRTYMNKEQMQTFISNQKNLLKQKKREAVRSETQFFKEFGTNVRTYYDKNGNILYKETFFTSGYKGRSYSYSLGDNRSVTLVDNDGDHSIDRIDHIDSRNTYNWFQVFDDDQDGTFDSYMYNTGAKTFSLKDPTLLDKALDVLKDIYHSIF